MKSRFLGVLISIAGLLLSSQSRLSAKDLSPAKLEFFENKIRPVLVKHCYECHSPKAKTVKGGLYVNTRKGLTKGGDSGPAIVPGKPGEGWLLEALRHESFEMPPSGKLPDRVIADFEKWIKMGAPDPRTGSVEHSESGIDMEQGRQFWAFVPPQPRELPQVQNPELIRKPLDAFVLARLKENGLEPSPRASRQVLIRRLYYDLIGLPPSPEEISRFLNDQSPNAYERLVDELLSSPAFGERWGRHWLDVSRYADSTGGGRSRLYGNSWRYRDYVIESFNKDKPFDQFLKEQIAGDLLPAESLEEERDQLTACGFLMLGPHNYELQDKDLLRMEVVDEQITTIGKAFLGMTIGCARCHDHKFDPIPQSDYYALAGIFRSTKSLGTGNVTNWITREMPVAPEQQRALEKHREVTGQLEKQIAKIDSQLKQLNGSVPQKSLPVKQLAGIVVDAEQETDRVQLTGQWTASTSEPGYVQSNYLHDANESKGQKWAVFRIELPQPGEYEVRLSYTANPNRTGKLPVKIKNDAEPLATVTINQKKRPEIDGSFTSLGTYNFKSNNEESSVAVVEISNADTSGVVILDAVQILSKDLLESHPQLAGSSFKNAKEQSAEETKQIAKLKSEKAELTKRLKTLEKNAPPAPPEVMAVREQTPEERGDMQLCIRGNIRNLGDVVPRGVLTVAAKPGENTIKTKSSGRLELAEWLASEENPLTARVMANRIWAQLFGTGIVRTVDNFGTTGELPSHPELLDHLAIEFMENHWSVKNLIREIVLSETYRRSSKTTPEQLKRDPNNRLLSHFPKRRADAEYLRDALLAISGRLEDQKGGPTIKPGTRSEFGYVYTSQRRSVYLPVFRNRLEELMDVFDFPDPNLVQGKRTNTTLPAQALFLMNHPKMLEFSRSTAERILGLPNLTDADRLNWLYLAALGREPNAKERDLCRQYLQTFQDDETEIDREEVWATLAQAVFGSIDFRYIE